MVDVEDQFSIGTELVLVLVAGTDAEVSECFEALVQNVIELYLQFTLTLHAHHDALLRTEVKELLLLNAGLGEEGLLDGEVILHGRE